MSSCGIKAQCKKKSKEYAFEIHVNFGRQEKTGTGTATFTCLLSALFISLDPNKFRALQVSTIIVLEIY